MNSSSTTWRSGVCPVLTNSPMGIIRELPPSLVNQIAAGEVVERPASVLKEIVENSLDAGATRISVVIDPAGDGLIHVRDNGVGILRDDLPRAFLRHATSKISSWEDLLSARSLGFRGEALASIASVSKVTVESRHGSEPVGTRLVLVPGEPPEETDWSGPVGTNLAIRDLFFNVPVRKKFLKSPQTEQGHLTEALTRIALGFPECQFDMATPSRKILALESRETPRLRILDLFPPLPAGPDAGDRLPGLPDEVPRAEGLRNRAQVQEMMGNPFPFLRKKLPRPHGDLPVDLAGVGGDDFGIHPVGQGQGQPALSRGSRTEDREVDRV